MKQFEKLSRLALLFVLFVFILTGVQIASAQSTVDLAVHYVEGVPSAEGISYDVSVYLSVMDSAGNPVKDLTADEFVVAEDSKKVEITGLDLANEEPVNLVLALDTSGSMNGSGINAAKAAASNFISNLGQKDLVAVLTFNDIIQTSIDFTTDHNAARDQIALAESKRGAGTCLYDAAYQAVQMSSTLPAGRRAVVLFTDGVDETSSGDICSSHNADDVIDLASDGATRTPVYTLGMGAKVDENALKRLAELTGGRSLYSPNASQLDAVFLRLSDQLRSQYKLTYKSISGPGAHTLAVTVTYLSAKNSDTRNFLLPALPSRVIFTSPVDGQKVDETVKLAVNLTGQGELVDRVAYEVDGKVVGTSDTTPYEVEVDLSGFDLGELEITAIVYSTNNSEIARKTISVTLVEASTPTPIIATPTEEIEAPAVDSTLLIGLGGLVLITITIIVFFIIRNRRREKVRDEAWNKAQSYEGISAPVSVDERTYDGWEPSSDALGMLIVTASDDATLIGLQFEITSSTTTLGRSADNDINFPKDSPVSRHHAEIVEKNGGLYLQEILSSDSSGMSKSPTYGTFLNNEPLGGPTRLESGDVIRLGKRVTLKFESAGEIPGADEPTYDGFITDEDDDRTREQ